MILKTRVLLAILGLSLGASAQNHSKQFGFKSDNDAYLARGQDKYYTNGIFISYRFANKPKKENSALAKQLTQLELGQKMYNAQSGYIPDMVYVDRPITAYLYAGASKYWFYTSENSLSLGVQLGTIGPNALGRQAQEFIHKLGGFYPPQWHNSQNVDQHLQNKYLSITYELYPEIEKFTNEKHKTIKAYDPESTKIKIFEYSTVYI